MLAALLAVTLAAAGVHARVEAADARWGGTPVDVYVAAADAPVGTVAPLRPMTLPPAAVPADAIIDEPPDRALSVALPEGAVLTETHLDERGPAAGLDPDLRAVPIPVEEGWGVTAGGWVDVWVLAGSDDPATLVARSRPVLALRDEGASASALVGLDRDREVESVTSGLALGTVLLAHAPPPGG
jgi:hypothetical protein